MTADRGNRIEAQNARPAAGNSIEDTAPAVPYWMNRSCPPWCVETHSDRDMAADRACRSGSHWVNLTMEDPHFFKVTGALEYSVPHLSLCLEQDYREEDPHIVLDIDGEKDIRLDHAEVMELKLVLWELLKASDISPAGST